MDYNSCKMIIVNECALYNLENFLEDREWAQRQKEKASIITVNAHSFFFKKKIRLCDIYL